VILADYHGYFKLRVLSDHFFSLNSCKKNSAPHVAAMTQRGEIVKRSVRIAGHATSVSLEPAFWDALREIAARRGLSLNALLSQIDAARSGNLSSAIRVFVLASCRNGELDDTMTDMIGAPSGPPPTQP
jgi:predicted DNA-binding ribbon-helix-helix protein